MAFGDLTSVIDSFEFETTDTVYPRILHVFGNIYAIACTIQDGTGYIKTIEIDTDGNITDPLVDSLQFQPTTANGISFKKISDGYFIVMTRVDYTNLHIYTFPIANDGTIGSIIGDENIASPNSDAFDMVQVSPTVWAFVYSEAGTTDGFLKTYSISLFGVIGANQDTFEFDTTSADFCKILAVNTSLVAIAYVSSATTKKIITVQIDGSGNITTPAEDSLTLTTSSTYTEFFIANANAEAFVALFQDSAQDGFIVSFTIASNGDISAALIDSLEFDASNCYQPSCLSIGRGWLAIVYRGPSNHLYIATLQVDSSGNIDSAVHDSADIDILTGYYPSICHVDGDIYAIAYRGSGSDGYVETIGVSTPPLSSPNSDLLMLGIG